MKLQLFTKDFNTENLTKEQDYVLDLMIFLTEQGHTVSITTDANISYLYNGIAVNGLPAAPDIVLTHLDNSAHAYNAARLAKAKLVGVIYEVNDVVKDAAKYGKYDALIFSAAATLSNFGNVKTEKVAVLPPRPAPVKKRAKRAATPAKPSLTQDDRNKAKYLEALNDIEKFLGAV